jgi:2-polyprenyl-3-methyl-5-hydroxy-6-metoxy-1,4-benzoquinol methylase
LGGWQRVGSVMSLLARVAKWQTRWLQVPVFERTWGFKSPLAHQLPNFKGIGTMIDQESVVLTEQILNETHKQMVQRIDLKDVATALEVSESEIHLTFEVAVAESRQTLMLLTNFELMRSARILEVGAGYGLASICLAMLGFEVTALEPGGVGFEKNRDSLESFSMFCGVHVSQLSEKAEKFDFTSTKKFDLIISNNVLEHVDSVEDTLQNLKTALQPSGLMVHSCANYTFPFEPHFGIPLVPIIPRMTKYFLPKSITQTGIWKSLNFVTASQVRRYAKLADLQYVFRKGTMAQSIRRLQTDTQFSIRHPLLTKVVSIARVRNLLTRWSNIPTWLATPMDFLIYQESSEKNNNLSQWKN